MSLKFNPAFFNARLDASTGPIPIILGSTPTTAELTIFAIGVRLFSLTPFSEASNIVCGTPQEWVAEAPSNLMTFPGDEEVLLIWQGPGGGGGGDGTEGDNMDNPFVVTALPFSAEGTTVGFEDDYDEVCPYSNSASADVVYMITSSGATYDFSLCTNTAYDSKIYILDIDGNTVLTDATTYGIACNDDACSTPSFTSPYVSELPGINLDAGLYYVVVDGYGSNDGTYTLDINLSGQQNYQEPVTSTSQSRNEYDFLGYNVYLGDILQNSEPIESTSYTVQDLLNDDKKFDETMFNCIERSKKYDWTTTAKEIESLYKLI